MSSGATYGLSFESRIQSIFRSKEVAFYDVIFSELFTVSYNRPNPFRVRLLTHGTLGITPSCRQEAGLYHHASQACPTYSL